MSERGIPVLSCHDVDALVPFYEALGFRVTFRQQRPNPYVCFERGGLDLHFYGFEGHVPEDSMGTTVIVTDDSVALYEAFASGLRAATGSVPISGIPRMTRPRVRQGAGGGFTVVDPAGNWLRVSASTAGDVAERGGELARVLETAARQGDARGDERAAVAVLEAGLQRHPDASADDRLPLLVYRAELLARVGAEEAAAAIAEARALAATLDPAGHEDDLETLAAL